MTCRKWRTRPWNLFFLWGFSSTSRNMTKSNPRGPTKPQRKTQRNHSHPDKISASSDEASFLKWDNTNLVTACLQRGAPLRRVLLRCSRHSDWRWDPLRLGAALSGRRREGCGSRPISRVCWWAKQMWVGCQMCFCGGTCYFFLFLKCDCLFHQTLKPSAAG